MTVNPDAQEMNTARFVAEFIGARTERPTVYEPREDSFLMIRALANLRFGGSKVLDMGTGSGILASYCAKRGAAVTASDIDPQAIDDLKLTAERMGIKLRLVTSNLFSRIDERFDIIVFNPPYLPSNRRNDRTIDGGRRGTEVIHEFLKEVSQHLTENGIALLLVSSMNNPESLPDRHPTLGFEVVSQESFFFEKIYVMKVARKSDMHRPKQNVD